MNKRRRTTTASLALPRATALFLSVLALALFLQVSAARAFNSSLAGIYTFSAEGIDDPACNQGSIGSVELDGSFAFTVKSGLSYYHADGRFDENLAWDGDLVGRNRIPFKLRFEGKRIIATNLHPENHCAPVYIGTRQ